MLEFLVLFFRGRPHHKKVLENAEMLENDYKKKEDDYSSSSLFCSPCFASTNFKNKLSLGRTSCHSPSI